MKNEKQQHGFTLMELGLVLVFSGFVGLTIASFFQQYTESEKRDKTIESLEISQAALAEYYGLEGVYPCPADPTLAPGDPNYGVAQCRDYAAPAFNPDACVDLATPNIACTTSNSRDGDDNGSNDVVMIGIIPFATIFDRLDRVQSRNTPFTHAQRHDGQGVMLTYAVTENMTNTAEYRTVNRAPASIGAIKIVDENDRELTDPPSSAHYALFSHGDNGRGGYNILGNQIEDCDVSTAAGDPPGPQPPGSSVGGGAIEVELENCDYNDAIFTKAIRSIADNGDYNDDILLYENDGFNAFWRKSFASPPNRSYIYNTNFGNVGVGTDNPESKLHIAGDLSVRSNAMAREGFCNPIDDEQCLRPELFGGDAIEEPDTPAADEIWNTCKPGQAAYAIGNNRLECRNVTWAPTVVTCAPNGGGEPLLLRGISNLGTVLCCTAIGNNCERQCAAGREADCDPV